MFEVLAEDLLGRIGRVKTRAGRRMETPAFLPVINPVSQDIPAAWMKENLGAEAVITNAYILLKRLREEAVSRGVHGVLGFDGVVMTDSGGYQVLEYGGVEAAPEEVAVFEEEIGTDIAVPLDVPTGLTGKERAEETVEQTLINLEATINLLAAREERRALWTGPVQGGVYLDLLERCARRVKEMGFDLYALGSPTPLMEGYRFDKLFEMLVAARRALGFGKPLHLFGAGHPMMFSFAVALGADTFDSASYHLYARDGRYITPTGTLRVEKLDYLPCSCPICSKLSAQELRELPKRELAETLAKHNLHVCFKEMREIKQAIRDGRLMELLEVRAKSHPSLYQGFRQIMMDEKLMELMELHTPVQARRGISLFTKLSLRRPKVRRARRRLTENYFNGGRAESAFLIPVTRRMSAEKLERVASGEGLREYDVLFYGSPYGLIPRELLYTYPFSQTEYPRTLIEEAAEELVELMTRQILTRGYGKIIVLEARAKHLKTLASTLTEILKHREIQVKIVEE